MEGVAFGTRLIIETMRRASERASARGTLAEAHICSGGVAETVRLMCVF